MTTLDFIETRRSWDVLSRLEGVQWSPAYQISTLIDPNYLLRQIVVEMKLETSRNKMDGEFFPKDGSITGI
jgi:hypothetical protein